MTNGYPSQWGDAIQIDDETYSQGSEDPTYFYGGSVYALWDEFTEPRSDGSPLAPGVRQAYFRISRPAVTHLRLTFGTFGGGADIIANMYERFAPSWVILGGYRETPEATVVFDVNLEPGGDYYFVVGFKDEATAQIDASYTWYAEVNEASEPVVVAAPPIPVDVGFGYDTEPVNPGTYAVPPIVVNHNLLAPDMWEGQISLSAPEASSVVATARPRFMVGVDPVQDADYDYTIQVQYAANEAMSSPAVLSARVSVADGGAVLTPSADLSGTVYWRARILPDGQLPTAWTAVQSFTVDLSISATTIPITWTVNASAARPIHLWHFSPPGPDVGDTVTIYGQGFPATGTVYFSNQDLTITSWKRVNAVAGGVISGRVVNPEHYEITFVAPPYDGPGELVTVTADVGEVSI